MISERREDKNKEIEMTVDSELCKLRNLSHCLDQVSVEICVIHLKS